MSVSYPKKEIAILIRSSEQLFDEINNMKDREERIVLRSKAVEISTAISRMLIAMED